MRVFLTGGSGYIGQPTIRALRRHGHDVVALARSDASMQTVSALGATPVRGSLQDLDLLRQSASEADGAVHLAWEPVPETVENDRAAGTAMQDGIADGPYVSTSGTWIYGDTHGVITESHDKHPLSFLAWRLDNDQRVLDRARTGGRPVIVMPGLVYGNGTGFIERFMIAPARRHGAVRYVGDGSNHWSLSHVEDLAELFALALDAPAGSVYAGITDHTSTVADLLPSISEAAGVPGRTESVTLEAMREEIGPLADGFAVDQQVSGERARAELGWNPPVRDVGAELAAGSAPSHPDGPRVQHR